MDQTPPPTIKFSYNDEMNELLLYDADQLN